jgi:hypothetical protein
MAVSATVHMLTPSLGSTPSGSGAAFHHGATAYSAKLAPAGVQTR